jgi:hypothetical protein
MSVLIMILGLLLAQQSPSPTPARTDAVSSPLDYEGFKTEVQPMFLAKRPGHARCITCHRTGQPRIIELSPGATTWTEEQSRQNFAAWQRVIVPGDPLSSRLLMHPLAKTAGGDVFHGGGKHWQSQSDPEFQRIANWIKKAAPAATASNASAGLSFETYRTRIEPIFLKERAANEGAGACVSCHSRIATRLRLQPLSPGATTWTEAQSRQNFEAVKRVVVPGDPSASLLAIHPLAQAAGGDAQHTGGKFWTSKDNPEYMAVDAWIKSGAGAAPAPTVALDFEYFKTNVQPIFLAKRPGHARCITCHRTGQPRLIELSPGATAWTDEQSRQNFAAWQRVVAPGDPLASRLLMHPLAKSAGGDVFHGGGKHWQTQSDPEFQVLVAWVRGAKAPASSR